MFIKKCISLLIAFALGPITCFTAVRSENTPSDANYKLKPGDILLVKTPATDKLGRRRVPHAEPIQIDHVSIAPIMKDGSTKIAEFGVTNVLGTTLSQLSTRVNQKRGQIDYPIELKLAPRIKSDVYIFGSVLNPGPYPITREISLATVLRLCGGLQKEADVSNVRVIRPATNESSHLSLWKSALFGKTDVLLHEGDVIEVPIAHSTPSQSALYCAFGARAKVKVVGAVGDPGIVFVSATDNLEGVINQVGGFAGTAKNPYLIVASSSPNGKISVSRIEPEQLPNTNVLADQLLVVLDADHPTATNLPYVESFPLLKNIFSR